MKWYRDNRIIGSIVIIIFIGFILFGYRVGKNIGPMMGKELRTENK
jgi:hypothetical protein